MRDATTHMRQAIDAARAVRGATGSNPWVGAVLARGGETLSTGATQPSPGPHAEAAALSGADAAGAELYVTLEPCAPFAGKRTPSCAQAIIDARIARVHVALEDPDSRVRGRGIAMLRAAGIEVTVGDGATETAELLRPYLKHRETGMPYVIAKFAASLDGKTATSTGQSKWITGEAAREFAHEQRAWVGAVMVGRGTAVADDPELTARPGGELAARQPLRIVVDSRGGIGSDTRLFRARGPVMVATSAASSAAWRETIEGAGAEVVVCGATEAGVDLTELMTTLGTRGITSVWAEGGSGLLGSLYGAGLVDETWAFLAPKIIGGGGFPAVGGDGIDELSAAHHLRDVSLDLLGEDVLVRGYAGAWSPNLG